MLDIAQALQDLHNKKQHLAILSSKHVLFRDDKVKIYGVGLYNFENQVFGKRKRWQDPIARMYLVPELFWNYDPEDMRGCDVWSMGVLASVMFYGKLPFKDPFQDLEKQDKDSGIFVKSWKYVYSGFIHQCEGEIDYQKRWYYENLNSLIKKMLRVDTKWRISMKSVCSELKKIEQTLSEAK